MNKHFGEPELASQTVKPDVFDNKLNYVGKSVNFSTEQS